LTEQKIAIIRVGANIGVWGGRFYGLQASHRAELPPQVAPFNLHDVVQVVIVPLMQILQTSTHWSNFLAS
jgi:hypothetical protein